MRRCIDCGDAPSVLEEQPHGKVHRYAVRCARCGRFVKWTSADDLALYLQEYRMKLVPSGYADRLEDLIEASALASTAPILALKMPNSKGAADKPADCGCAPWVENRLLVVRAKANKPKPYLIGCKDCGGIVAWASASDIVNYRAMWTDRIQIAPADEDAITALERACLDAK